MPINEELLKKLDNNDINALEHLKETLDSIHHLEKTHPYTQIKNLYKKYYNKINHLNKSS